MRRPLLAFSTAVLTLLACGSEDAAVAPPPPPGDNTAYTSDPDKTVVVGASAGTPTAQASAQCVKLPSGECADAKLCPAGERRDVIVDAAGKVVAVVCYPASAAPPPALNAEGNVALDKNENNGVVAIDGAADGVDIGGDVTAAGNNVVVYGEGPGVSVIGGSVGTDGNNFSLRGVTVKKDVTITGNNATLVLCVIEGNVTFEGNNNVIAECSIGGKVTIIGNNNVLVGNEIGGGLVLGDDKNSVCDGNVVWNDTNTNLVLDPAESGAAITCGGGGGGGGGSGDGGGGGGGGKKP